MKKTRHDRAGCRREIPINEVFVDCMRVIRSSGDCGSFDKLQVACCVPVGIKGIKDCNNLGLVWPHDLTSLQ